MVEAQGIPLAVTLSAANVHDSRMMLEAVDAIEPIKCRRRGRPRKRPTKPHADKAYDSAPLRAELRRRGIAPLIMRDDYFFAIEYIFYLFSLAFWKPL